MSVIAPSTKEQIVLVAERLFAERGIEGVSLRQIGAAAGNGNNSAVQYHFGSKDRLVQAVFEYRLPRLRERGSLVIAERRPDDLRSWVECGIRVLLEQSELEGSNYMSFVATLYQYGRRDVFEQFPRDFLAGIRTYHDRLVAFMGHVDEPLRTHRIAQALALIVHAASDRERARATGQLVLPFAVALGDLLDGMVGFLEAPVSVASRDALERADPARVTWPVFL
jgi:AcrR family transcriptional regulator